jgi:DNA-binding transcriptional regulator YiaG
MPGGRGWAAACAIVLVAGALSPLTVHAAGGGDGDDDPPALVIDDSEVAVMLAESRHNFARYGMPEFQPLHDETTGTLERWLAGERDVDADRLRGIADELAEIGRWRRRIEGRDPVAGHRRQMTSLLREMAETAARRQRNLPQFANKGTHRVGRGPTRGSLQGPRKSAESGAVTTLTSDAIRTLVGRNVRRARLWVGLSQAQLAKTVGVGRNRVADWEAGRHQPSTDHLVAIVAATAAPDVGWFFEEHPDE